MTLEDLKKIKREFEGINQMYRRTFTLDGRLRLIERVKALLQIIEEKEGLKVRGNDARDGVIK